jgi:SnoaL-like domain
MDGRRDVVLAAVQLSADYARLIDGRDAAGFSELFTPDGCLDLGRRQVLGRPALLRFAEASPVGVHVAGLPSLTDSGTEEGVTCESAFVFVNTATGAIVAGWYRDELAWDGDRLIFVRRLIDMRAASPVPG